MPPEGGNYEEAARIEKLCSACRAGDATQAMDFIAAGVSINTTNVNRARRCLSHARATHRVYTRPRPCPVRQTRACVACAWL